MGTDRELLEKAAKAAGLEFKWREGDPKWGPEHVGPVAFHGGCWQAWNPLEDDSDALRLAVQLRLDVLSGVGCVEVCHCPGTLDDPFGETLAVEYGADLFAATRRAIVRAAAAIGDSNA